MIKTLIEHVETAYSKKEGVVLFDNTYDFDLFDLIKNSNVTGNADVYVYSSSGSKVYEPLKSKPREYLPTFVSNLSSQSIAYGRQPQVLELAKMIFDKYPPTEDWYTLEDVKDFLAHHKIGINPKDNYFLTVSIFESEILDTYNMFNSLKTYTSLDFSEVIKKPNHIIIFNYPTTMSADSQKVWQMIQTDLNYHHYSGYVFKNLEDNQQA